MKSRLSRLGIGLALLTSACDGRGSSGFDISEALLIQRVISTQQCLSREALLFCPADRADQTTTPTPADTTPTPPMQSPTPTATAIPAQRVDTGLANGTSITCTRARPGDPCRLTFTFQALGFGGQAFRVAAQLRPPGTAWEVAPPPRRDFVSDPPRYESTLNLPVPVDARQQQVRFAVLVFASPQTPVPDRLMVLSESAAEFAFVTPDLALEVITTEPFPTATATDTAQPSATVPPESTPTATATAVQPATGPEVTYFGIARADSAPQAPSDVDGAGRPVFVRPFGAGFSIIVEARPGVSRRPVGPSAYRPGELPDLQMILSRPLGDGSPAVCDAMLPEVGGVPATQPFLYAGTTAAVDAMNDLGCRVDNGQGEPRARSAAEACTQNRSGEFAFVSAGATVQYCLPIAAAWAFPGGDTVIAVRLLDVSGTAGEVREIVLRNAGALPTDPTPTRRPRPPTVTRTPLRTATRASTPVAATPTPTPTGTPATPSLTPTPADDEMGPVITYFGLSHADDRPFAVTDRDASGRPRFTLRFGYGVNLVVEARPGPTRRSPGLFGYSEAGLPDVQLIASQPLGDGNAAVCDTAPPLIGGVAATNPLEFEGASSAVINDFGCRLNDGAGEPRGRLGSMFACTVEGDSGTYAFVTPDSTVQYCLPIAQAWSFAPGDTVIAVRVRDAAGAVGARQEIVVRVEPSS
ncbi:MAG: hypothetical protein SF182_10595 [Deltaproteobacteria bacterium]|nr:hypothetical protein [Deltaproteobacteria bacterium]